MLDKIRHAVVAETAATEAIEFRNSVEEERGSLG
jgi:hypothetical protein